MPATSDDAPGRRVLRLCDLNRATLARQLLLSRERRPTPPTTAAVVAAIEQVAGLQSQDSRAAAIGLWTRLPELRREQIAAALLSRTLVKGTLMRATQHLVSVADYLALRPVLQPSLTRWAAAELRRRLPDFDLFELAAAVRPFFDEPHTATELRRHLAAEHGVLDVDGASSVLRTHLALLQVPAPGLPWGVPRIPAFVNAAAWLGREVPDDGDPGELVRRYLGAFGPARAADVQQWAGVPGLARVVERLRPRLRTLFDERSRELFDLPDGGRRADIGRPRPDPPPLYLPAWDNTLLAYADRTRVVPDALREPVYRNRNLIGPVVLVGGFAAATWALEERDGEALLSVRPRVALGDEAGEALARPGERLARFVAPEATRVAVVIAG